MSITEKVRNLIPSILKNSSNKEGLTFNELNDELYKALGAEICDADGNVRKAILRGITLKLDSIPIPNVAYVKIGKSMRFVYAGGGIESVKLNIALMLKKVEEGAFFSVDLLKLTPEERVEYLNLVNAIEGLKKLL